MPKPIIFGEIPGIEEGHYFDGRKEMMPSSFHRSWGSGIDGNGKEGTAAIVLSGGYEDDYDLGDEILYTGAGGNENGKQIADQTWEHHGNAGLLKSMNEGLPVRVIRGHKHKSKFSPKSGYTYAGLYSVLEAFEDVGKSGYKVCRYKLIYSGTNPTRKLPEEIELDHRVRDKKRREGTVLRIIRDSKIALSVKQLYNFKCQVCGTAIKTKSGFYAEGAHIRPLGKPHNGDDSVANLLCLCPNHHVMLDKGTFSISDEYKLLGEEKGKLYVHDKHQIELNHFKYHRECHGYD